MELNVLSIFLFFSRPLLAFQLPHLLLKKKKQGERASLNEAIIWHNGKSRDFGMRLSEIQFRLCYLLTM